MLGALLGNYRVTDALGEGGMGVVYIGRHETLGRRVVVKVLRPHVSQQAGMVQRFFNEAQAATAIHHPGIAQVFDFGTTPDGQAYFVMELLQGETLAARLKRGPIDIETCCRIGRQIANVLQATHEAGITHRDLKPDNLFLVPEPEVIGGVRVKVLDFGLAKLANEARAINTRTGQVMGTPSYMSPEQCRGIRNADARSDIYALGCVLFKMVCGRVPFTGAGALEVIVAHVRHPVPDPRAFAPHIPVELGALIKKMLAKKPSARPQTMAAVSQAFDKILGSLGAAVSQASPPTPAPAPAPTPWVPEDPSSLSLSEPTMDDTLLEPPAPGSGYQATGPTPGPITAPSLGIALAPTQAIPGVTEPSRLPNLRARWHSFVLAGLVVAGAAILTIVLVAGDAGSPEVPSADEPSEAFPIARFMAAAAPEPECEDSPAGSQGSGRAGCPDVPKPAAPERTAVKCNAAALTKDAQAHFDAGRLDAAFVAYEAAYACSPAPARALKPLTLACNLRNLARARWYWKRIGPATRARMLGTCVRNGISQAALNAP